jgi:formylmethanofuran dehydrogenase subunit E
VETNFDAFIFHGCEEPVDAVGASVGHLGVEELGVDVTLGDSLLSSDGLLAIYCRI